MAKLQRNFIKGRMNKSLDERLVPNGEYIDALNVRIGSTELSEIGAVENSKGNSKLTDLFFTAKTADGPPIVYSSFGLSNQAKCIGAYEDSANETIYWFVTDPANTGPQATNKLDLVVSYNVNTNSIEYHVISVDDGGGVNTTLNFNSKYLITSVDKIDDMLFFTDNYNQPRVINVTRDYPDPAYEDSGLVTEPYTDNGGQDQAGFAESLLVIKKPPFNSPTFQLTDRGLSQNFLEDRFICFAYRYRYADDMYSATSQFTNPAFVPKPFSYDASSNLNAGMINFFDTAIVTFNTGGPLVVGIDLLFKEASNPVIRIIEKLDKADLSGDYQDETYTFSNNKIYSLLDDNEILRLYDNVPLKAKAQTVMGKRLMYGNYIEGYDVSDVDLRYIVDYDSYSIGQSLISPTFNIGNYLIDGVVSQADSIVSYDLTGLDLKAGSRLDFAFIVQHGQYTGASVPASLTSTSATEISFSYFLINDFANAYELSTDLHFISRIGTVANIKPVYAAPGVETSCDGSTMTDEFNCMIPITQHQTGAGTGVYTKIASGIFAEDEPIKIGSIATNEIISFQMPAMVYVPDPTAPANKFYEYYQVTSGALSYISNSNSSSLHSNRDYEVGIMYMDDYNRSTTILVSPSNIIHIPCSKSAYKTTLKVKIPKQQNPPIWATRYKFAIKQNKDLYETVYSNLYFFDDSSDYYYFRLEGENAQKVKEGDILNVKIDGGGPKLDCTTITVLEKKAQEKGFIKLTDAFTGQTDLDAPAGVYMQIRNSNFVVSNEIDLYQDLGVQRNYFTLDGSQIQIQWKGNNLSPNYIPNPANFPILIYKNFNFGHPYPTPINAFIPEGTEIKIWMYFYWQNWGAWKKYTLNKTFTTTQDHEDVVDWWVLNQIQDCLEDGYYEEECGIGTACANHPPLNKFTYLPPKIIPDADFHYDGDYWDSGNWIWDMHSNPQPYNFIRWIINDGTKEIRLAIKGGNSAPAAGEDETTIQCRFEFLRPGAVMAFETPSQDAAPDIFYESSVSHAIVDKTPVNPNGYHSGNVQTQTASLPAIINTEFMNCYAFGNGIESYKIRDSITRNTFGLGNRVSAVLEGEDYREVHRFADITYSGTYGYNINNLNEFNLGILNYKVLEPSFGEIQKLFARATDILTLQENKISYVLAGKNLLSDSAAGGVVTSVPEVLGTQIARIEEYGIGNNPESFAEYGYDKYFTDSKRGVVIQLKGSAYSNEQLSVISDMGMSSWFRDLFLVDPNTQKLGGFDPYMKEYVLSSNSILLPVIEEEVKAGISQKILIEGANSTSYVVELGEYVGTCTLIYSVKNAGDISGEWKLWVTYNSDNYPLPDPPGYQVVTGDGQGYFTFNKNKVLPSTATVNIAGVTPSASDKINIEINLSPPETTTLNIIQVCISDNNDKAQTIHNEYIWTSGTFVSPLHSNFVSLAEGGTTPLISEYEKTTVFQGGGIMPIDGATVELISNKYQSDNFAFDASINNFLHLRSATLYNNTPADIATLIGAASATTAPSGSDGVFSGTFTMLSGSANDNLYLIYDYRKPTAATLCYSNVSADDACCTCGTTSAIYLDGPTLQTALAVYTTAALSVKAPDGWYEVGGINRKQVSGLLTAISDCDACKLACGTTLSMDTNRGYYTVEVELGAATGAVVIDFDFEFIPDGVKVVYNGSTYNDIYSPHFGHMHAPGTNPVFTGVTASDCGVSLGGVYPGLIEYRFNGTSFNDTGLTQNVTVDPTSAFLQATGVGTCKMIIPKTAASPSTATITIISPCDKSDIEITAACPAALSSFLTTRVAPVPANIAGLCTLSVDQPRYHVLVNGTAGNPAVGDIMFQDANGVTRALAGFYAVVPYITGPTASAVIEVDANGIIINSIVACMP